MLTPQNGRANGSDVRIGINAQLLSPDAGYRRAGIHQYIAQVLRHLPLVTPDTKYIVYARHPAELLDLQSENLRFVGTKWPTERRLARILWEQTAWPWSAAHERLDLLHSMAFVTPVLNRVPEVVTIYDLSFYHFAQTFPATQRVYLQRQTARSVRGSRRVITISEASRRDIHQLFGVPLARIETIYPGVDPNFAVLPAEQIEAFRRREDLPERFLLHVGTLQPRKNIPVLLYALSRLARPDLNLVLVGGKGWMYDEIFELADKLGLREQVYFAGYVADEELPYWYNAAAAFVLPSLYEGFGMPVVEAMACGTPVIAARSSSLPEAGGDAALYFEAHDADDLSAQLTAVLDDDCLAARMRQAGQRQAATFSWHRAGQATAGVYHKALFAG